ncbi:MAG: hypothetical protein EOO27_14020 [Comamonadaceae bacterium]|nr:MAG: hypothetical protein EOO27_14020 [Comamonadaceae bacterium]
MSNESWRRLMICTDWQTCTHSHHIKVAKEAHKAIIAAPTIVEAATIAHDRLCDQWAQASHGGTYVSMAQRHCGHNRMRHSIHIANLDWLQCMWISNRAAAPIGALFEVPNAA